jgi:predicted dehydrogenase
LDKVRFIAIGVGGMGRHHINLLKRVPEAEIVALVDPSAASIEATRQRFEDLAYTPAFSDYREALKEVEADAVVIVTPHNEHFEQGMDALEAGLHVLMEKPFVAGSEKAEQLVKFAEEKGLHLAVSYQRHLEGHFVYLRELIANGELGTIQYVSAYQAQAWLKGTMGTWRQDPELACGGQLNDSGSHLLDIVLWVTDLEPKEVSAVIDNRGARVDIDTALSVRCTNDAILSFNIVGSSSIGWWEDVSIHGDKGTALVRNGSLYVAREGERSPQAIAKEDLPANSDPDSNFVDLVLGRITEAAAPASCGLRVSRLTEAAWRSAESGKPITI